MDNQEDRKRTGPVNRRDLLKAMTVAPAAALVPLAAGWARYQAQGAGASWKVTGPDDRRG